MQRLAPHPRSLVLRNTTRAVRSGGSGTREPDSLLLKRLAEGLGERVSKAARGEK